MRIACNYYQETEELVADGLIDIDYFKFPALGFQMDILGADNIEAFIRFAERLNQIKPVLLHGLYPGPYDLNSDSFITNFNVAQVDTLLRATNTPGISLHPSLHPVDRDIPAARLVSTIVNNLRFLADTYPHVDFISVENVDSPRFGELLNPEIYSAIVTESGAAFLLDISHAFCASFFRGEDFISYLQKLPLHRVYEIHINGWVARDRDIMCHLKINPQGYQTLQWLLGYCQPEIVTIEYGRDADRLGIGNPLMSPERVNPDAKKEIAEQVSNIRALFA